ncbi:hypothetical protein [Pimelobacter sp. 30-1]|uniref:hypothetical protein n=1 Tax=Pimelobacter sp. 30-1 TaxID=2004991 RepID=UPI001C045927|nr:hypothetical protein [Pimelobacter sp. 30-1]MBU2693985.1 hypothetical protein [Pimelobacter sp. 30-1]
MRIPGLRRTALVAALAAALALPTGGLPTATPPASAAVLAGSVVVYQCGTSVCAIDPDVPGSRRVVRANAKPAGVTTDGRTAGVVDRSTQTVSEIALAPGGLTRTMATPGAADPPDFAAISGSGGATAWVWYYASLGWYARVAPAGAPSTAQASSTMQLSIGWKGDQLMSTHRGTTSYGSRICLEVAGGPGCDTQLAVEPDLSQQTAFPDINAAGTIVAVRGPESTGFGLPYYGALALYRTGSTTGPDRLLTTGQDTHPEFSAEGDRIVFERKDQGIWVINTNGTGLRKIADGTMPFWGGARRALGPALAVTGARPVVLAKKRLVLSARCPAANTSGCTGTLTVTARGKVVARGGYRVAAGRSAAVPLRLTAKGKALLRASRKVKATVQATGTVPAGATARAVVTIKRKR